MSERPPLIALKVEDVDARFYAIECRVDEELHAPMWIEVLAGVTAQRKRTTGAALHLIGKKATVTVSYADTVRAFRGRVAEVNDEEDRLLIVITSAIGRLTSTCDYRMFTDATAIDIVTEVLGDQGISVDSRVGRAVAEREQCVQVFESHVAFCSRILAEEGITWFPKHDEGEAVTLVDEAAEYEDPGLTLEYHETSGMVGAQAVHEVRLRRSMTCDKVSLRDYDFEHPTLDLKVEEGDGALESYDYPGGFTVNVAGKALARVRMQQLRSEAVVLEGEAVALALQAGYVFTLKGAPHDAMNGRWLVFAVSHEAIDMQGEDTSESGRACVSRFRAVPAATGYRAARRLRPVFGGVETSTATGQGGSEIHLDPYGRIKTLLRWDRRRTHDHQSSGWARVMQPQLSGAIFNPRVGWEELIGFVGAGGDRPVMLGRLYNGAAPPPAKMPDSKVQTHFGTMTTPNGASGSFLKFDDTAGSEKTELESAGDYDEQTGNDKVTDIAVDDDRSVTGKRTLAVGERKLTKVDGAYKVSVSAVRNVSTDSDYSVTAGSESIMVGGARLFRIGGDYVTKCQNLLRIVCAAKAELPIEHQSVYTKGPAAFLVGADVTAKPILAENVSVAGAAIVKISGSKNVKCDGYTLSVKGLYFEKFASRDASGSECAEAFRSAKYKTGNLQISGSAVTFEATSKMTIKSSGVTITLTPSEITVEGDFDGGNAFSIEEQYKKNEYG
jgi:type VI secretion system secreted protein VgrG